MNPRLHWRCESTREFKEIGYQLRRRMFVKIRNPRTLSLIRARRFWARCSANKKLPKPLVSGLLVNQNLCALQERSRLVTENMARSLGGGMANPKGTLGHD